MNLNVEWPVGSWRLFYLQVATSVRKQREHSGYFDFFSSFFIPALFVYAAKLGNTLRCFVSWRVEKLGLASSQLNEL